MLITIPGKSWEANTYLIVSSGQAIVIDPAAPAERITDAARAENAEITRIILTHGHFDHMLSMPELRRLTAARLSIHLRDAANPASPVLNGSRALLGRDMTFSPAENTVDEGSVIRIGNETMTVLHTPGHTGGSICLLYGGDLICGDTLFADGFGRYDLPGGDVSEFVASIRRLHSLEGDITIHPGHGKTASLADATDPHIFHFLESDGNKSKN